MSSSRSRAAFLHRGFRYYVSSRFLAFVAHQILIIAVSQSIYEMTHSPLYLGYVGLALFLPKVAFTLPAGHAADHLDRRTLLLASRFLQMGVILGLLLFYGLGLRNFGILYGLLFMMGTGTALGAPASQAVVTQLVPIEHFNNAVTWNSSSMQLAFILGPAIGGWLYAILGQAFLVLIPVAVLWVISIFLMIPLPSLKDHIERSTTEKPDMTWKAVLAGLHYVFKKKTILGTISMDLFAVLFGGAVALMPIFANEILKVGPSGLGILRAAPSVGAAIMAVTLAHLPPLKRPGLTMLWCVAFYGISTLLFGISTNFIFSLVCLVFLGAFDMVSVVIRGVLVQVETPPGMRGRVSAVNMIFIGASNELGEFESGLMAKWFGTVPSVIIGALGTLGVVGIWAWRFPEIRKYKGTI